MKFNCKQISISDDELSCTLTLSETEDNDTYIKKFNVGEIKASIGQYILLQRTYPEGEFEKDYYYIETSDLDKSGELKDFSINLYRTQFVISFGNNLFEIYINVDDNKFEKLKQIIMIITNNRGQVNFYE